MENNELKVKDDKKTIIEKIKKLLEIFIGTEIDENIKIPFKL